MVEHKHYIHSEKETMFEIDDWVRRGYTMLSVYAHETPFAKQCRIYGPQAQGERTREFVFYSRMSNRDIVQMFTATLAHYGKINNSSVLGQRTA